MPANRTLNKRTTSKRLSKTVRNNKKNAKTRKVTRKMRGGCGCDKMNGGNGLDKLPTDKYYPLSDDSRLENANLSSSVVSGGRPKKHKKSLKQKKSKKSKKMIGGEGLHATHNAVSGFGDVSPLENVNNLVNNASTVDDAIHHQPINTGIGIHSQPIV